MGSPAITVVVGLVSGVLSGQFGIGGGLVTTPAIRLVLGYPALIAVGTPLPVIVPTAVVGAWSYARGGLADVRAGLYMGATGAVASVAGALLTQVIGAPIVMLATAALILYVAADMALHTTRTGGATAPEGRAAHSTLGRLAIVGLAAGLYSGLFGLGGGFIIVPLLTRWFGFPLKRALGTSLVTVAALAVPGTVTHYLLGHVDPSLALWLMVGSVPGALLGAKLSVRARERTVAIGFAVLMATSGIVLAAGELRSLLG